VSDIVAILVSDTHFTHNPPVARSAEPDWYGVMARQWDEVYKLHLDHLYAPLIIAGDVFDHWQRGVTPELINFVITQLSQFESVYAIPGQHDLPYHGYDRINQSAYWTLVQAGVINNLSKIESIRHHSCVFQLTPFWWGRDIKLIEKRVNTDFNVAVCHSFIWTKDTGHVGADEDKTLGSYRHALKGYDAAVFGDNHKGFNCVDNGVNVMNCGTFYCRTVAEVDYNPQVGLLCDDGSIIAHKLDVSKDVFLHRDEDKRIIDQSVFARVVGQLSELGADSLDFRKAVFLALEANEVSEDMRRVVIESMA